MTLAMLSQQVVTLLAKHQSKLVLAESCTAGLIAATLGGTPGVSQYLCGSAVVYREQTKIDWLNVSPETLRSKTAVSTETTTEIAYSVLRKTNEANWSLGITGHLGPNSPPHLDGQIFVACFQRLNDELNLEGAASHQLLAESRIDRQEEATEFSLLHLTKCLTLRATDN